jgi:hypothetical protein
LCRKGLDEDDGSNYFMLVNTSSRVVAGSRDLAWKVGIRVLWIVFILVDLARKIM